MGVRRNVLLIATFAALVTAPNLAQREAAAAAPNNAARSTAATPNLSGMWAHPWLPGYEPLSSGPTSLRNLSRSNGVSNPLQLVGDYHNPILKPGAAETVKKL